MNVLLICYTNSSFIGRIPLGVAQVSSLLKREKFKVNLLYLTEETTKNQILNFIKKINPDFIAMSALTNHIDKVKTISEYAKKISNVPFFVGGSLPTFMPDETIQINGVDMIGIGEADEQLVILLNKLKLNEDYSNVKNIWIKKKGAIIKNQLARLNQNLDILPFPDREIFDYRKMLKYTHMRAEFMASRGCPHSCSYCYSNAFHKIYDSDKNIRFRSPENVVSEIKEVVNKYHPETVMFNDDIFTLYPKWIEKFCDLYIREIPLSFSCNSYVNNLLDENMIKHLKNARCNMIKIGIETGDEEFRKKVLNKHFSNDNAIKVFRLLKKYNIESGAFIMIGFPKETLNNIKKTIEFIKTLDPDYFTFSVFYPLKMTDLYNLAKDRKELSYNHIDNWYDNFSTLNLKSISKKEFEFGYKELDKLQSSVHRKYISKTRPNIKYLYDILCNIIGERKSRQIYDKLSYNHLIRSFVRLFG